MGCCLSEELPLTLGGSWVLNKEGTQTSFLPPELSLGAHRSWKMGTMSK